MRTARRIQKAEAADLITQLGERRRGCRARQPRADDQVLDSARYEDLPRPGLGRYARSEVDPQTRDVVRQDLDLADMDPGPDLKTQVSDAVADRERAAHGSRRPVVGGEEPVTEDLDILAAEPVELAADRAVVVCQQGFPARVAEPGGGRTG